MPPAKPSVQVVPASSLIGLILKGVGHSDLRDLGRRNGMVKIAAELQPDFFDNLMNSVVLFRIGQPELLPNASTVAKTNDHEGIFRTMQTESGSGPELV